MIGSDEPVTVDVPPTIDVVIPEEPEEDDYLDDELRAELAAEEQERRLISQIAISRGLDPDADEGFTPE